MEGCGGAPEVARIEYAGPTLEVDPEVVRTLDAIWEAAPAGPQGTGDRAGGVAGNHR